MKTLPGKIIAVIIIIILALSVKDYIAIKKKTPATHVNSAGYADPVGKGLRFYPRIDMGVDYAGKGSLYALGNGTITRVYDSGWPGGVFIGLHLTAGRYAGKYVYYAESIIPAVSPGDHVHAGQLVGTATGCSACGIELGWAAPPGTGKTMADVTGEDRAGLARGDAGFYPTAYGVSYSDLIRSLGGPGGSTYGRPVQGSP